MNQNGLLCCVLTTRHHRSTLCLNKGLGYGVLTLVYIFSHQETTVKQLQSPLPLPTTLPLLSASIASTKTVIANPVLYLNNHIHDILHTIVQMKTPPHPNVEDVKVTEEKTVSVNVIGFVCS